MNELFQVASGEATDGAIQISQDANIYVAGLEKGKQLAFTNHYRRQSYLVCLEGQFTANRIVLNQRDAMKIWREVFLTLTAIDESQLLMVAMANGRYEKE